MLPLAALVLLAASLAAEPSSSAADLPTLGVRELSGSAGPSARARALAGSRVRLVGFMARLEEPGSGGFWLAQRPVECDESGAGTGDLPPGAVRVLMDGDPPEPITGPIAVTGVLELGGEQQVSFLRLRLDPRPASSPQP
ncbi:MAG: hypothetical protein HZB56_14570 [Deltaproteobacteria bacterium]|nr:hypothetical protein [Deltaproteobacteria bacterium]